MKPKISIFITAILFLLACNDDNNDNEWTNSINKKVIKTERIYNGNEAGKLTNNITYTSLGALNSYQVSMATAILNVSLTYNQVNQVTKQLINGLGYTYTYNNQGRLESISSNANRAVTTLTYNENGYVLEAIAKSFDDLGNETNSQTNVFTYENDMLKSLSYENSYGQFTYGFNYNTYDNLVNVSFNGSNSITTNTYLIQYDNKVNPTYKILENINVLNKGGWSLYNFTKGNGLFEEAFVQGLGNGHTICFYAKNNFVNNQTIINVDSYEYQYDNENFPTQLIESGTTQNGSYTLQYNYIYEEY